PRRSSPATTTPSGCGPTACPPPRQRDRERGPAADTASHAHRATVTLHDTLRDPEPKARALPGLRREERLEDLRQDVVGDALAGVAHLDLHGVAPEELRLGAGTTLRRHRDGAALGHRVSRIQQYVEQHLLEL